MKSGAVDIAAASARDEMESLEMRTARGKDTTTAMTIGIGQMMRGHDRDGKRIHIHHHLNAAAPGVHAMDHPPGATVMEGSIDTATAPAMMSRNFDPLAHAATTATLNTAHPAHEAATAPAIRDPSATHPLQCGRAMLHSRANRIVSP